MADEAAAKARMMADLGLEYRDLLSGPVENNAQHQQENTILTANHARRSRIVGGATDDTNSRHVALRQWNTADTFGGDEEDISTTWMGGQGHRARQTVGINQMPHLQHQNAGHNTQQRGHGQEHGRRPMPDNRNFPQPRASREPLAEATLNRPRPVSPRSFGTRKFRKATEFPSGSGPSNAVPVIGPSLAAAVQATTATHPAPPLEPPSLPAPSLAPPSLPAPFIAPRATANGKMKADGPGPNANKTPQFALADDGDLNSPWPIIVKAHGELSHSHSPAPSVSSEYAVNTAQARLVARFEESQKANASPPVVAATPATNGATTTPAIAPPPLQPVQQETQAIKSLPPHQARRPIGAISASTGGMVSEPTITSVDAEAPTKRKRVSNGDNANTNGGPRARIDVSAVHRLVERDIDPSVAPVKPIAVNKAVTSSISATSRISIPVLASPSRAPAVQDVAARAKAARLKGNSAVNLKAFIDAVVRTPEQLAAVEKYYQQSLQLRSVLEQARSQLAHDIAKLATTQDHKEAYESDLVKGYRPDRTWLLDAAFTIKSGGTPEDAAHPTVQKIFAAMDADGLIKNPAKVTDLKERIDLARREDTPELPSAETKSTPSTAQTKTMAASTPTPARPAQGLLAATYYNVTGSFLGNKEYQLSVPVTAHVHLTSKTNEYDPRQLADAMEGLAKHISGLATTV